MIYIFGGAFDPPHVWHTSIIQAILHYKNPEKIIIIPSSARNDKSYAVSDEHRLTMLEIFAWEIDDARVVIDDYFVRNWQWEMITKDVDIYVHEKYGTDIIHVFGTDTVESMSDWDSEWYAAQKISKLFAPRASFLFSSPEIDSYGIENYEIFLDSHFPDISSTELRSIIPEYTGLKTFFEENPKFIIPGLSKRISQYILEHRLYRPKLEKKPKILVHVCCGPDVTMPILQLRDEYDIICFWYDPNIQPKSEYDKRYEAFVKVCEIENIPYIKWAYDVKTFFSRIKWVEHTPERGEKCTYCYDMRMMVSAKLAAKFKIPLYTSSLNTSPKKDLEKLFLMWHKYAEKYGVEFLDIPFRKKWGFAKSVEYTREHDIYRQNYCGCIYSIREGGESEMKGRMVG
jgi:epoxyqueuosine reductase